MVYHFDISALTYVVNTYLVKRKTVWQVSDPDNILIILLDGECEITTLNTVYILHKGDAVLIPANQSYLRKPIGNSFATLYYIHFKTSSPIMYDDVEKAAAELRRIHEEQFVSLLQNNGVDKSDDFSTLYFFPVSSLGENTDEIFGIINKIQICSRKEHIEKKLLISSYIREVFAIITSSVLKELMVESRVAPEKSTPHKLKKAILYINQNCSSKISLDDICSFCSISKPQLIRYFKSEFGKTPIRYVLEFRINRAKVLLQDKPHLAIKEVAGELGFDDQHYFARAFYKVTGETPSHYKYRVVHYVDPT